MSGRPSLVQPPGHLAELSIRFCPVCGRDDRFQQFGTKYHTTPSGRCEGQPLKLVYGFVRVAE